MAINLVQKADGSMAFLDEASAVEVARIGGGAAPTQSVPVYRMPFTLELAVAGTADTAGALAAVANPFGRSFYITDTILVVTTQSSGACTVSVGCAANATTLNATLISGQSVATAGMFGGALIANRQIWTSGLFLTASTASGASSGLVGRLLVTGYFL
jgi:hypothetical protein